MIVVETNSTGDEIGVIYLEEGELFTETGSCMELIEGKRALGMTDEQIYAWLAAGGYDTGYQKAYEVEDEYQGDQPAEVGPEEPAPDEQAPTMAPGGTPSPS